MHTIEWLLSRGSEADDLTVIVHYDIEPYVPARVSGPPEDCYPAEGGCVTDMRVTKAGSDDEVEITDEDRGVIERYIEANHDHEADRYPDPDAAYDARGDEGDYEPPSGWDD